MILIECVFVYVSCLLKVPLELYLKVISSTLVSLLFSYYLINIITEDYEFHMKISRPPLPPPLESNSWLRPILVTCVHDFLATINLRDVWNMLLQVQSAMSA